MPRAWKSPVRARDTAPTLTAAQQVLPFAEPVVPKKALTVAPAQVQKLWFCIWLPNLPLEACRSTDEALAIVEEQHGIHRVLQVDLAAAIAGIMPGQSANAALALLPTLRLEERSRVREQQVLEALATWLERFSSFVSIAAARNCRQPALIWRASKPAPDNIKRSCRKGFFRCPGDSAHTIGGDLAGKDRQACLYPCRGKSWAGIAQAAIELSRLASRAT